MIYEKYPEFINDDPRTQRQTSLSYTITKSFTSKRYSAFFDHIDLGDKTILDLGSCVSSCGAWVLEKGAKFYQAVEFGEDIRKSAVKNLKKYFDENKWNVYEGYVEDFFKDNNQQFDIIVASGIIYCYFNPNEFIDELVARSNNIILESRNPTRRWVEEQVFLPFTPKQTRLLEMAPLILGYSRGAPMMHDKGGDYNFTGTCPTQGYVDLYFELKGYEEDEIVHNKLQETIPNVYNLDRRFGKLYSRVNKNKIGLGLKDSIKFKNANVNSNSWRENE